LTELRVRKIDRAVLRDHTDASALMSWHLGTWQGIEYKGIHVPIISSSLFAAAQNVFAGRNKPKYRKHNLAFAGFLTCAHDNCTVTTKLQKGKYVYYRCSHGRGKCSLPYMREQDLSDRMGDLLKDVYVPETVARTIVDSLQADSARAEAARQQRSAET
jgi:hypothetical protein